MYRILLILLVMAVLSGVLVQSAFSQNPFLTKPTKEAGEKVRTAPAPAGTPGGGSLAPKTTKTRKVWISYPLLNKIIIVQAKLNQKISTLVRKAKKEGSLAPLLPLIALTFLYGVLHAAGPGHGKAVAGSYVLTQRQGRKRILVLGNLIALFHGLSGMLLVLVARFILETGVQGSVERTTYVTQLVSYGALAILGFGLMMGVVLKLFKKESSEEDNTCKGEDNPIPSTLTWKKVFSVSLVMGMVPCPGVVLVMIFCLSLGMAWLGVLLSFTQILGMALTISCVVLLGSLGKSGLAKVSGKFISAEKVLMVVEFSGALLLTGLGALFFLATLSS